VTPTLVGRVVYAFSADAESAGEDVVEVPDWDDVEAPDGDDAEVPDGAGAVVPPLSSLLPQPPAATAHTAIGAMSKLSLFNLIVAPSSVE
jgi:hypothetical protein